MKAAAAPHKTLYLLRHAKSSRKDETLADHDRPLSKRGRAAAMAMAKHLARLKIAPDLVLCSTALRARQTLKPIEKRVALATIRFEPGLYYMPESKLWHLLWALSEEAASVLLIGHDPALHELALALADAESRRDLPALDGKYPTGALAGFAIAGAWRELRPEGAHLFSFVRPKALVAG